MNCDKKSLTVFLAVDKNAVTNLMEVRQRRDDKNDFREFIKHCLDLLADTPLPLTDHWIFQYNLDTDTLPKADVFNESKDYNTKIQAIPNMHPSNVVSLYDAYFCRREGLDPLSPEGQHRELVEKLGYRVLKTHFGIFDRNSESLPTYRAVDTGRGILLYDLNQSAGSEAYNNFLQHCADNYFDKKMNIEHLRLYDVNTFLNKDCLVQNPVALNFNFNHHRRDFTLKNLTAEKLLPANIAKEGFLIKQYDMSPTSECYTQFVTSEDIKINLFSNAFNVALLEHIQEHGYPEHKLVNEWRLIFPYLESFKDIKQRIEHSENQTEYDKAQSDAKSHARDILNSDYPDRRVVCTEMKENMKKSLLPAIVGELPYNNLPHGRKM